MSNSLDPDQAPRFVRPDLGPNCLPRLSADDTGRQRVQLLAPILTVGGGEAMFPNVRFSAHTNSDIVQKHTNSMHQSH